MWKNGNQHFVTRNNIYTYIIGGFSIEEREEDPP
jgi:hypothetical protein